MHRITENGSDCVDSVNVLWFRSDARKPVVSWYRCCYFCTTIAPRKCLKMHRVIENPGFLCFFYGRSEKQCWKSWNVCTHFVRKVKAGSTRSGSLRNPGAAMILDSEGLNIKVEELESWWASKSNEVTTSILQQLLFIALTLVCRLGRNEELLISVSDWSEKIL